MISGRETARRIFSTDNVHIEDSLGRVPPIIKYGLGHARFSTVLTLRLPAEMLLFTLGLIPDRRIPDICFYTVRFLRIFVMQNL